MKEHQDWVWHSLIEGEEGHQTHTRDLSDALLHIPAALDILWPQEMMQDVVWKVN